MNDGRKSSVNDVHYTQPVAAHSPAFSEKESLATKRQGGQETGDVVDHLQPQRALSGEQPVPPLPSSTEEVAVAAVDERNQQIAQLKRKLEESVRQQHELQLRHLAEKQNLQRRAQQDIEKAHKFSLEGIARALLPILDSFERAIAAADRENVAALPMIEGLDLTFKSLHDALQKFGIEAVGEPNTPFDPERHQAMCLVDSEAHPPNHVVTVMQKGYTLNGRLLRAAMVTVVRSAER